MLLIYNGGLGLIEFGDEIASKKRDTTDEKERANDRQANQLDFIGKSFANHPANESSKECREES